MLTSTAPPATREERAHAATARLGQLVSGKWRLERLIGVGGMAAVFEASHGSAGRVAIKVLHADLTAVAELRERFLSEGYAANRVSHPGVVTVRDEGTTADGSVFLVMDLLRGQTLAERLAERGQRFSVREALTLGGQLLDVLVHAHDRGIVHRDIKPENVFLTLEGRVRLLDFGIARIDTVGRTHATRPGTTLGTPAFMPPEQALGRWDELDGRCDLWALGATLFLMLSGRPVREGRSDTELLLAAMTQRPRSLAAVAALPRAVVAVIDRALSFEREARFPDARSMQLALCAAESELSEPDQRATLPPQSIEPVALSVHGGAQVEPRRARARAAGESPPSASATPLPASAPERAPQSRLPLFLALGFSVGIGIVLAARLNSELRPPASPEPSELAPAAAARAAAPSAVTPSAVTPSAGQLTPAPSESARPPPPLRRVRPPASPSAPAAAEPAPPRGT